MLGFAVSHRQQPPNSSGDSVFRHWRIGEPAQFLQRGLTVLDTQLARGRQMVGNRVAEDPSARSTRAAAATAARAERRRFASSKFANRLAVARTSRRIRRSSHASLVS